MNKLNKFFYIIIGVFFSILLINITFRDVSNVYKLNNLIFILLSIIVIIAWYLLYRIINKYNKYSRLISIILFLVIAVIELFIYYKFEIPYGWDFEYVTKQAYDYAYKQLLPIQSSVPWYLQHFPNNMFLYISEIIFFKSTIILHVSDPFSLLKFVNGILIYITILLNYLYIKKKFGEVKACFSLIVTLFFLPLFLYIPIIYSDTLSIIFIPLLLYLSSFFKDENKKKRIISVILFVLFTFIGCKIKMTVIFIPMSIIVMNILKKEYKIGTTLTISLLVGYMLLSSMFNYIAFNNDRFNIKYNDYGAIPTTHWIMMGIDNPDVDDIKTTYGGYSGEDYVFTESFKNGEEAKKANIKEIKRRINKYGLIGYLNFLSKKAVNCWGDGSYFVPIKLHWMNKYNMENYKLFLSGNNKKHEMLYFMCAVQFALIILIIGNVIKSIKNNNYNSNVYLFSITLLLLFLLIWENRSRYLYNYIPIFILIISITIDDIIIKTKKITNNRRNYGKKRK